MDHFQIEESPFSSRIWGEAPESSLQQVPKSKCVVNSNNQWPLENYRIKAGVLGDFSTGKTSMIHALCELSTDEIESTIGLGFFNFNVDFSNFSVNVHTWDMAGTERYRSIIKPYIRDLALAFITFDVNNRSTWEHVNYWRQLVLEQEQGSFPLICLLGCKADLEAHVTKEEIIIKANEWKCPWWIVSTKETRFLQGSKTEFTARSQKKGMILNQNIWAPLRFDPETPREQIFTVFAEMVRRFHEQMKEMDRHSLNNAMCSLGTNYDSDVLKLASDSDMTLSDTDHETRLYESLIKQNKSTCC